MSRSVWARALLAAPDATTRADRRLTRTAIGAGAIFVVAGLVKFVFHHWELHAFRSFGLPWPSALEVFAGVVETFGGVLLVARRSIVPVAVLLSVTMIVAIISSGVDHGDVIPSLTLAPALLVAMLYLLVGSLAPSLRPPSKNRWRRSSPPTPRDQPPANPATPESHPARRARGRA